MGHRRTGRHAGSPVTRGVDVQRWVRVGLRHVDVLELVQAVADRPQQAGHEQQRGPQGGDGP